MTVQLATGPGPRTEVDYPVAAGYPNAGRPRIVRTAVRRCLAVNGRSAPASPEFQAAMQAVFGVAYSLMFLLRGRGADAHVGPAEGQWERLDGADGWSEGEAAFDPSLWRWTLLIAVPEEAAEDDIRAATAVVRRRHPSPELERLRVIELDEGLVVEALHVGPYATEPETIARMHAVAKAAGLMPRGAHHEIYLGDPRRSAPQNLRTVLRQPLQPGTSA